MVSYFQLNILTFGNWLFGFIYSQLNMYAVIYIHKCNNNNYDNNNILHHMKKVLILLLWYTLN